MPETLLKLAKELAQYNFNDDCYEVNFERQSFANDITDLIIDIHPGINNSYKNSDGTSASAFYDKIMIVGSGISVTKSDQEVPVDPIKVEAENATITGATVAGDTSAHPGIGSSGVASNFSNKAFVKNFNKNSTISLSFVLPCDKTGYVDVKASVTNTTSDFIANDYFDLYVNNQKVVVGNDVMLYKGKAAWLVQTMRFATSFADIGSRPRVLRS